MNQVGLGRKCTSLSGPVDCRPPDIGGRQSEGDPKREYTISGDVTSEYRVKWG